MNIKKKTLSISDFVTDFSKGEQLKKGPFITSESCDHESPFLKAHNKNSEALEDFLFGAVGFWYDTRCI